MMTRGLIDTMHEELKQFEQINVRKLVVCLSHTNVLGTKWIFKNKTDDLGQVIRNNTRLVAQGYTQVKGINFDETFALAHLESIKVLLSIACSLKIKLFQMDVNSALLHGYLNEEVYVEPKRF